MFWENMLICFHVLSLLSVVLSLCLSSCLMYRYLSLDSFPSISGNDASCVNDNHLPRPCPTERVTPRHPDMAVCSGYDVREGKCFLQCVYVC